MTFRFATCLRILIFALVSSGMQADGQSPPDSVDADVLLRNGTLHLGDGQPPIVGDVALAGDRIIAVGQFEIGRIGQVISCDGMVISPGFIDLHNHSDKQVLQKETRAVVNFVTQGCTTIVTGNCGSGPIDVDQYYRDIDLSGVGVNVAHLIPQGQLRREVIGLDRRRATPDELERMKRLAATAMNDGAWGMSTGLIYVPSANADTDELVEIAQVVAEHEGIYASHIRNENVELLTAVQEALEIGQRAGIPVHISHFKSSGQDSWGLVRVATELIQNARQSGQRVTADQYPYTASSTSLAATVVPSWARAGGREKMLARFDDPKEGKRIQDAITDKLRETDAGHRLQIAHHGPQPNWAGKRIAYIAKETNMNPYDLVLQIIRDGGASIVNHSINEKDVRFVMLQPWVATASDGRAYIPGAAVPHPRNYGTFPRRIGYYSLKEQAVPLEQAIRSATGLPADILGMSDRGYLRPGYAADLIVWDPIRLMDTATFENPHSYSQGLEYVFVNGRAALVKGTPTGALVGRSLRKQVTAPRESGSPFSD